jgi:hypothetical protein
MRLSVFRSSKNIYAQVIDDLNGRTVASASSLEKDLRGVLKTGGDKSAAEAVGKLVAERALENGFAEVYLIVVVTGIMVVSRLSLIVRAKLVLNSKGSLLWHVAKDKNEVAEIKKRIRS